MTRVRARRIRDRRILSELEIEELMHGVSPASVSLFAGEADRAAAARTLARIQVAEWDPLDWWLHGELANQRRVAAGLRAEVVLAEPPRPAVRR